jgi:hypothetical protein
MNGDAINFKVPHYSYLTRTENLKNIWNIKRD